MFSCDVAREGAWCVGIFLPDPVQDQVDTNGPYEAGCFLVRLPFEGQANSKAGTANHEDTRLEETPNLDLDSKGFVFLCVFVS